MDSRLPDSDELYCEAQSDGERHPYDSCQSFSALRERGCFGRSTYDMSMESRYAAKCDNAKALITAKNSSTHYFSIDSVDWWKTLPAEVIPISDGVYSDESREIAAAERAPTLRLLCFASPA